MKSSLSLSLLCGSLLVATLTPVNPALADSTPNPDRERALVNVQLTKDQCQLFDSMLFRLGLPAQKITGLALTSPMAATPAGGRVRDDLHPITQAIIDQSADGKHECNPVTLSLPQSCGGTFVIVYDPFRLQANDHYSEEGVSPTLKHKTIVASGVEIPSYFALTNAQGADRTKERRVQEQLTKAITQVAGGDANHAAGELANIKHAICREAQYTETEAAHGVLRYLDHPPKLVNAAGSSAAPAAGAAAGTAASPAGH